MMKGRRISVFYVLMALLFVLTMGVTAFAENPPTEKVRTGTALVEEFLSLRTAPSKDAQRIAKINNGEKIFIVGEEGDFYKVRTEQQLEGYVLKRYIILSEEETGRRLISYAIINNPSSGENRNYNMALACTKLDGYTLEANQQFEWYSVVGVANKSNGYKTATVISGGKYTQGYGGGVCQVSTALYNAALKANLQIDKVCHHSLPSSYVAEGYDATVSYSSDPRYLKTLIFTNNTGSPIQFEAFTQGGTVTIRMYQILSDDAS